MDLKQFEQEVCAGAAPYLKELPSVLPAAIYEAVKRGHRLDDDLVRDALARAGRVDEETRAALAPEPDTPQGKRESGTKHTLRAQELLERLAVWTEGLREEGFGQTDPPDKTLEDAAMRVEESSRASNGVPPRRELEYVGDRLVRERSYRILLPYIKPGHEHVKHVNTDPETFWEKLAKEAERMECSTGFPKQDLVMHVLSGFEPRPSRARIKTTRRVVSLADGNQLERRSANVTYNVPDLKDKEHRHYYKEVREHVGGKSTNGFDPADRDLLELVEEMGGPPPNGSGAEFYRNLCQRWNREYAGIGKDYKSYKPDSLRTRYGRLKDRLSP